METTIGRFCSTWAIVEAKAPAMFKDASICSEECAKYSKKYNTCIDFALKEMEIQKHMKEGLH